MLGRIVKWALNKAGHEAIPLPQLDPLERRVLEAVRPFTMTSDLRLLALMDAVRYVVRRDIPGCVVECGVWRGGSMMAAAMTLLECERQRRKLVLCDTFEGMSAPTAADTDQFGRPAEELLKNTRKREGRNLWCIAGIDDVKTNLERTGYPPSHLVYLKGRVEQTLPSGEIDRIALLRLDTDWYESTKHELDHLFPLLADEGVLIVDDYGCWQGSRRATDEYLSAHPEYCDYLHRIDDTGRLLIKRRRERRGGE